ncbi:MAG: twin-arginine translocase TatA/TatE family subunit [Blastocatellia bacterium]|jgi:sec-independent protein translocase protein TatA
MGNLGMPEILMILVIALIIFGPRKLPELGKSLGHGLAQFRKASDDFKRQWEDEVETEKRRLDVAPAVEAARHNEAAAADASAAASSEPVASAASADAYATSETIHAPVPTVEAASVPRSEATVHETKRDWM